jgi:hypothetical protein
MVQALPSSISLLGFFASFSGSRATMITLAPASASLCAVALPMPDEPPVITDDLALDLTGQAAVDEEVRVEVAFPVVPQFPRVGVERRHLDAGPFERRVVSRLSKRVG